MKFLKSFLAVAVLACAVSVQAQTQIDTVVGAGTNSVPLSTTNDYSAASASVITAAQSQNVTLAATFKYHSGGSGTSNIVFVLDGSADGANWVLGAHRFFAGAASTATNTTITNIDVKACAYLRLNSIENINTITATNILLKYSVKPGI